MQSYHSPSESQSVDEESEGNPFATSDEDREMRLGGIRRGKPLALDFKVEIPEFEGQLNSDEFID